jgi:hypothetical protein
MLSNKFMGWSIASGGSTVFKLGSSNTSLYLYKIYSYEVISKSFFWSNILRS